MPIEGCTWGPCTRLLRLSRTGWFRHLFRFMKNAQGSGMDEFLKAAIDEARIGLAEGGIPIGSVLGLEGRIIGRGHNRRVQSGSAIHHAEMNCLENAGRLPASSYRQSVIYSTLSPCD